jgi:hypothetical protein
MQTSPQLAMDLFTSRCIRFLAFLGQISRFPAKYKFDDQPSKITNLHVLLDDRLHSQAGSNNSHGWSAKNAGDIDKLSFRGRLFFGMGDYWLHCSSSRGGLWPPIF